jgi:hypothetical protein
MVTGSEADGERSLVLCLPGVCAIARAIFNVTPASVLSQPRRGVITHKPFSLPAYLPLPLQFTLPALAHQHGRRAR